MIQNLLASALLILPLAPVEIPDIQSKVAETTQAAKTKESVAPSPQPPPVAPNPVQATTAPQTPAGGVLACIRRYESRGNYRAVSPSGKYRNAYQMDTDFWLTYGGNPALAGRHELASVAEQDAVARRGLRARGLQPWPTPNRLCR